MIGTRILKRVVCYIFSMTKGGVGGLESRKQPPGLGGQQATVLVARGLAKGPNNKSQNHHHLRLKNPQSSPMKSIMPHIGSFSSLISQG